jgi:predicted AAA+ superfamily ATPase
LARDLEVSPHTIKHWIEILQTLYVIFVVPPYTGKLARSLLKESKIYFYDNGKVRNEPGARLENLVACALLKDLQRGEDLRGEKNQLCYVRDREKREVDFAVVRDGALERLIEVKTADDTFSKSLGYFQERLQPKEAIQVVGLLKTKASTPSMRMTTAVDFLVGLE